MSDRHVLAEDDDGHWYVIPRSRLKDFYNWLSSDEAEMGSQPDWAEMVGGSPSLVSFVEFEIE